MGEVAVLTVVEIEVDIIGVLVVLCLKVEDDIERVVEETLCWLVVRVVVVVKGVGVTEDVPLQRWPSSEVPMGIVPGKARQSS